MLFSKVKMFFKYKFYFKFKILENKSKKIKNHFVPCINFQSIISIHLIELQICFNFDLIFIYFFLLANPPYNFKQTYICV